jgi:hypothetical protein
MQVRPIDKAYGAEAVCGVTELATLNGGTTCGNHSLILATNGADIAQHIFIYENEGDGVPVKTGTNASTNPKCKHVCIPRYGMMIIEKKKTERLAVFQFGGPASYSDKGGGKKCNVMFTPVAHI